MSCDDWEHIEKILGGIGFFIFWMFVLFIAYKKG